MNIGILVSGGLCPGLNTLIKSISINEIKNENGIAKPAIKDSLHPTATNKVNITKFPQKKLEKWNCLRFLIWIGNTHFNQFLNIYII